MKSKSLKEEELKVKTNPLCIKKQKRNILIKIVNLFIRPSNSNQNLKLKIII